MIKNTKDIKVYTSEYTNGKFIIKYFNKEFINTSILENQLEEFNAVVSSLNESFKCGYREALMDISLELITKLDEKDKIKEILTQ